MLIGYTMGIQNTLIQLSISLFTLLSNSGLIQPADYLSITQWNLFL